MLCFSIVAPLVLVAPSAAAPAPAAGERLLENDAVRILFGPSGIVAIDDKRAGTTVGFARDDAAIVTRDEEIDTEFLTAAVDRPSAETLRYRFRADRWTMDVVYELKPAWRFVTKQIFLEDASKKPFQVIRVEPCRGELPAAAASQRARDAALLRFSPSAGKAPTHGLFLALQNPFFRWKHVGDRLSVAYAPDVPCDSAAGPFVSDRLCIGPYAMTGRTYPASMTPDWKYVAPRRGVVPAIPTIDEAEVDALVECARSFLLVQPQSGVRVHIPWCENDYQIDVATPEGLEEYRRIIDQAAAFGCRDVLFTPANGAVSSLDQNRDAWGWENLLWWGLGQKIRKGEWDPAKDELPEAVRPLVEHARSKNVRLLAYVYPSLPFKQDPAWTAWVKGEPGGYLGADTGLRSFQDWLVDKLVAFHDRAGAAGYSFDHWWIAYDDTTSSKYAQWAGCRRILGELRRRVPDIVIDGRQQYHHFGVWTWLAGSYPHPLNTDEQPQSFRAFPDLHWDRASADRQRYIAWWYRIHCFTPPEIMPGYITHQTPRLDEKEVCRRDRYRTRDWDYLGWRYSLLSSIATAPFNHVVNMIPARDPDEFARFPEADKAWFRGWLDWADANLETLRNVRPIIGQPRVGGVDGTAAFKGDRGFVFLFNPNYRPLEAEFSLDASIGLASGERYLLRQRYPEAEKGLLLAAPAGCFWKRGERVRLPMPGAEAVVIDVEPALERPAEPMLFNAKGRAALAGGALSLQGVAGEFGRRCDLKVLVPPGSPVVRRVTVNGVTLGFMTNGSEIAIPVRFGGVAFGRRQQIGAYDPAFAGGSYRAEIAIPARVFKQLEERKKLWPIPYTDEDLLTTWNAPHRLLLFVNVADPADSMQVALKIDGGAVELKRAYTSVYPQAVDRTFVGWYVDVSTLEPDKPHAFELNVPALEPGRFQGLFLDNVEAEYTEVVARAE